MIGGLIMPYISILNDYILVSDNMIFQISEIDEAGNFWIFLFQELPRFLIGLFGICAGLLTLIFPETSYDILPDSVEDAKCLGQKDVESGSQQSKNPEVLREKLFSEDWVDAGNGIIVNFTEGKDDEWTWESPWLNNKLAIFWLPTVDTSIGTSPNEMLTTEMTPKDYYNCKYTLSIAAEKPKWASVI